jgi:hypothetical protein
LHYTETVDNPFWTLTPATELNPFRWTGSPDYVSADDINDFIGYAFQCCANAIRPDYFYLWNMVQRGDLHDLRENFLLILERTILACHAGELEPGRCYDWGQWSESLNIGNLDEGDADEVRYTWSLDIIDEPGDDASICIALGCHDVKTGRPGGHFDAICLQLDAIQDVDACQAAIERARKVNT